MYKGKGWNGWRDFLGIDFIPFTEAKKYAQPLGLTSSTEWYKHARKNGLPEGLPVNPEKIYRNKGWNGWRDFLGIIDFLPFTEAKKYALSLGLRSHDEWKGHVKKNDLPKGIPRAPEKVYKKEGWKDWGDFLGTGRISTKIAGWSIQKVKELIKDLIENKVIYEWTDDERYHLLLSKGVLNIERHNPYLPFFKDLIKGFKSEEERKKLEEFVKSEQVNIPEISPDNEEIAVASTTELAELIDKEENVDSLEDEKLPSPKKILAQTEYLESI